MYPDLSPPHRRNNYWVTNTKKINPFWLELHLSCNSSDYFAFVFLNEVCAIILDQFAVRNSRTQHQLFMKYKCCEGVIHKITVLEENLKRFRFLKTDAYQKRTHSKLQLAIFYCNNVSSSTVIKI